MCETYEAEIKAAGNDTTEDNDEDDIMNDIENLGLALNETRELLNQLKCVIYEARDNHFQVESVTGTARGGGLIIGSLSMRRTLWHGRKFMSKISCSFVRVMNIRDRKSLIWLKQRQLQRLWHMSRQRWHHKPGLNKVESLNIEYPLVMDANSSMKKVSGVIELPLAST